MRTNSLNRSLFPLALLAAGLTGGANAQDTLSAKEALAEVARNFGPEATAAVVELTGVFGQDQPEEWELIAWDEKAVFNLHQYKIELGEVEDEGDDYARHYPDNPPSGFIPIAKLKIDSTLAFEIAEKEARRARMGFNSLNYRLAAMEYATEPVWTLDLVDADDQLAGKVYISAETGEVLRTLFIYRNEPLNLRIVDSAAPRPNELSVQPQTPTPPERVIIGTPTPGAESVSPALPPMPNLTPQPSSPTPVEDGVAPPPTPVTPPPTPGNRVIPPPPIPQ